MIPERVWMAMQEAGEQGSGGCRGGSPKGYRDPIRGRGVMTNNQSFYQQLKSILETESVVVATIVEVIGSAPREVGAMMAVCSDGSIIGTVGGGAGEGKVIKQALTVLKTRKKAAS